MWDAIGQLCWHQHGGSGYNFSRADVLEMEWDEVEHHLKRQEERREAEAKAIREANKSKK